MSFSAPCKVAVVTCTSTWPGRKLRASCSSRCGCVLPCSPELWGFERDEGVGLIGMLKKNGSGPRPLTTYEQPSDDPRRYTTVLGNVVNFDSGPAPHLGVRLAGCVLRRGESHLLVLSDARPWCCLDGRFVWRRRETTEESSETGVRLCETCSRIERKWGAGCESPTFASGSGAPVRLMFGGIGGGRILRNPPCPVSWQVWAGANRNAVTASTIPHDWAEAALGGAPRLAQRAKPQSAGGDMLAYSSSSGSRMSLPPLLSYAAVKSMCHLASRHVESGICSEDCSSRTVYEEEAGQVFLFVPPSSPVGPSIGAVGRYPLFLGVVFAISFPLSCLDMAICPLRSGAAYVGPFVITHV